MSAGNGRPKCPRWKCPGKCRGICPDTVHRYRHTSNSVMMRSTKQFASTRRINLSRHSGNAEDSLTNTTVPLGNNHCEINFSDRDADNDMYPDGSCAIMSNGSWWFNSAGIRVLLANTLSRIWCGVLCTSQIKILQPARK